MKISLNQDWWQTDVWRVWPWSWYLVNQTQDFNRISTLEKHTQACSSKYSSVRTTLLYNIFRAKYFSSHNKQMFKYWLKIAAEIVLSRPHAETKIFLSENYFNRHLPSLLKLTLITNCMSWLIYQHRNGVERR